MATQNLLVNNLDLTNPSYIIDQSSDLRISNTFRKLRGIKIKMRKNRNVNIKQQNRHFKIRCKLCFQFKNKDQFKRCMTCNHLPFCVQCSRDFIHQKILDRVVKIQCQVADCNGVLNQDSPVYLDLPQNIKTIRNRTLRKILKNQMQCKVVDCHGFFNLNTYQCDVCSTKFCKKCEQVQHEGECILSTMISNQRIKKCPNCKIYIQKIDGCNHIICDCKQQFCFICLKNWNKLHHFCRQKKSKFNYKILILIISFILIGILIGVLFIISPWQ